MSTSRRYMRKSLASPTPSTQEAQSDSIDGKRSDQRRSIASEAEVADILFGMNHERTPEPGRVAVKSRPVVAMEIDPEESGLGESEIDDSYRSNSPVRQPESKPSFPMSPASSDSVPIESMDAPRILDTVYPPGKDDGRRVKLAAFLKSPEYQDKMLEDPQALMPFVAKLPNGMHECSVCKYQQRRTDRIVSHFRRHINHRPFACDGSCSNPRWFVSHFLVST